MRGNGEQDDDDRSSISLIHIVNSTYTVTPAALENPAAYGKYTPSSQMQYSYVCVLLMHRNTITT